MSSFFGKAKEFFDMGPELRQAGEFVGLVETAEEKQIREDLDRQKKKLREQAETGVTPELREFARRAARARAALGAQFADRRLTPEQKARFLGRSQAQLSGGVAAGMAEAQRRGREFAEQQLQAINQQRRAEMQAEQDRNLNALLSVIGTGAALATGGGGAAIPTGTNPGAIEPSALSLLFGGGGRTGNAARTAPGRSRYGSTASLRGNGISADDTYVNLPNEQGLFSV
tara:strand:- start:5420 stop:6106 length:687 start_codon:yes stop_codon:yes gene_type:complete